MIDAIPTMIIKREEAINGIQLTELFVRSGLCKTKSDARRLIEQGGAYLNNIKIQEVNSIFKIERNSR
jgi:tyrosyl-tRNA synthetase